MGDARPGIRFGSGAALPATSADRPVVPRLLNIAAPQRTAELGQLQTSGKQNPAHRPGLFHRELRP
jgi:hypothetical protein